MNYMFECIHMGLRYHEMSEFISTQLGLRDI